MKRKLSIITMMALVACLALSSCDKIKDKIFKAFVTQAADVDFSINIVTTTDTKGQIGSLTQNINIDSIIKAETSNAFSLNDIKSINVEEVKITALNADPTNNFANFEEGWLDFNTNTNTTAIQIATGLNPDVFADTWFLPVDKSINLKDYLKGTQLAYIIAAKARRVTTKKLDCKMAIKFKIN